MALSHFICIAIVVAVDLQLCYCTCVACYARIFHNVYSLHGTYARANEKYMTRLRGLPPPFSHPRPWQKHWLHKSDLVLKGAGLQEHAHATCRQHKKQQRETTTIIITEQTITLIVIAKNN